MKQKLFTLLTLLVLCVTGAWADGVTTLFSTDFSNTAWSSITKICDAKNADNEIHNGITFRSYNSTAKPFEVSQSDGTMTWCNNNMGDNYWIAIPVTGVNGSLTITVDNGSTATRFKYVIKKETSISGSPGSGANNSSSSSDPATVTISDLDGTDYVVYLGRQGSSLTTITSITITTPTPATAHKVTYKAGAGTGDDVVDNTATKVGDCPNTFTAPAGLSFAGWNTAQDGSGTAYAVGANVTDDLVLYAQWEAENPIIFSMTDITKLSGDDVTNDKDVAGKKTGDVIATFNTGSSAIVFNNKSGAAEMLSSSEINLGGSGDSYFKATFTRELAEGDVISSSVENSFNISYQNSSYSELTLPYTIPSGSSLIGKTTLFVKKKGASRFSSFTIRRPGEDEVNNPVIAFSSNSLTITCSTKESSIYYTTDGTEPTVSSTKYTAAVALTNSCTVRAKAFKGANNEYSSEIVKKDCYVNNASTEGFMAKLGMSGGSMNADNNVWTSTDNKYVFTNTSEGRTIQYATLETNSDAFKINHNDVYTLKVSDDIKITKIVFVGKSWLTGSASTISIDDFDGTGNFYAKEEGVDTYVGYQTFTPQSELDYGATVTIRPSANQLGAYIEVYGTIKTYDVTKGNHTNGDFTIATSPAAEGATVTLTATPSDGYEFTGWEILKTEDSSDIAEAVSLSSATTSPATFTMPAYGVTVNATFANARYTVTYNANGGTCATASEKQAASGAVVTLPTPTFEGCTFDGWYNAGNKIGDAGASYTPTADITLYAKWTDNTEGKLFSYIDGNYGDRFLPFDGTTEWVSANGSNKDKTFTDATTNAQFVITKGAWDNKANSISALAKFANGTSEMSVVIPEGKVATVKIMYGSYNTSRKLTVGGTAQAEPAAKFDDSHTNQQIAADMTEVTLNNQAGTLTLGSSSGNIYIARVIVTDLSTTIEKTIPANKEWITFCSTANLDFSSDIAGLEGAYTITAHADKATALTATKMTGKVKAGTGLLLRAAAVDATNPQVITIPVAATGEEQADNMLKGVTVDTEVQPTAGDYTNLGLSNGEFHPYSAAGTLAAGKAYLQVPTAQMPTGGNNARLYIVLDGEATGINTIENSELRIENSDAPMYNLAGQRVTKSYKGVVIVNGKKYINK